MADFFLDVNEGEFIQPRLEKLYGNYKFNLIKGLTVYAKDNTYTHIEQEDDFIIVLGHCYYPGKPIRQALYDILSSFKESMVENLKRVLVGQFIIIIKKNSSIYMFSDCLQTRNIFYSQIEGIVGSSFSALEKALNTSGNDLNLYKVFEYWAMQHTLYPGWLGSSTMHKRINRLRPFEYLVINSSDKVYRIVDIKYSIDNEKELNNQDLSSEFLEKLKIIIEQDNYRDKKIGVNLTGGQDTRLIGCIAAKYYKNVFGRLAASKDDVKLSADSFLDPRISKKVAKSMGIPLDIFWSSVKSSNKRFYELTDGFSPVLNSTMAPLIDASGSYDIVFGGAFGTELFFPLPYQTIDEYIIKAIDRAKKHFDIEDIMWKEYRENLYKEFDDIKKHYIFTDPNDRDFIRMFALIDTGCFASSILSPLNISGMQMDPYGSMPIIDIAFKVSEKHRGSRKKLGGTCLLQKTVMSKENYHIGKIMTTRFSPMLPLSKNTITRYLNGYLLHVLYSVKYKTTRKKIITTHFNRSKYLSDGWNSLFVQRIIEQYGNYAYIENEQSL